MPRGRPKKIINNTMESTLNSVQQTEKEQIKQSDDKLEISRSELSNLLSKIDKMNEEITRMRRGELPIFDDKIDNTKEVLVSVVDGCPVIGWDTRMWQENNIEGKLVDYIKLYILKDGEKKDYNIEYLKFVRNIDKVKCKIISERIELKREIQGYTTVKKVNGFKTVDTGIKVPVKIETPEVILTIDFNGNKIEINNNYLN